MSKYYSIATVVGCAVVYFLLIVFCLSEPVQQGVAPDSTMKGKERAGARGDCASGPSSRFAANGIQDR